MNHRLYEEFNNPDKWHPRMPEPLSRIDLARFQMKLNQIFGLALDNSPNVRIVWAQNWEQTKVFNRYSGDWYPRYLSHTLEDSGLDEHGQPTVSVQYVAAPRYVIEGRVSMADNAMAFTDAGVEKVVVMDEDKKPQVISSESFTAAVAEEWEEILRIVDHDHIEPSKSACCEWNVKNGYECWGYYRSPDAGDLQYLDAKWRQMKQFFETAPGIVRTAKEKQRYFNSQMARLTEEKRKQKEEVKKALAEFWQSKFAKLDQSVTEQHHGPFHFLSGHNSAGIPAS